jgi:hypothetical protein
VKLYRAFTAILLSALFFGKCLAAPGADEIISKVIARSADSARTRNQFAYQRVSRVDYLDEKGEPKKNSVRVYQVAPVSGSDHPISKLIQVNGRAPTQKEESHRSAAREAGDKSRSLVFGEELLSRYQYKLIGEEFLGGRKAWILEFNEKASAPEEGILDKLLNAMHGRIWVDQQDYELAKLEGHLGRKVSFFGGIAGAIEKLDLQLVQKRVDAAAWLTEALTLDFAGRKLLSSIHLRCLENCSEFRKVPPLAQR